MHQKHLIWIQDKNSASKKQLHQKTRQRVQTKLRLMKNKWWDDLAKELQDAADRKDSEVPHPVWAGSCVAHQGFVAAAHDLPC